MLGFHNVLGNKQVIGLNAVEVSQCYKDMKNNMAILLKRLRFERYGMKTGEKANTHNQHWLTSTRFSPFSAQVTISMIQVQRCSKLTHDDHAASWSKSSAALNSLTTIDHAASL